MMLKFFRMSLQSLITAYKGRGSAYGLSALTLCALTSCRYTSALGVTSIRSARNSFRITYCLARPITLPYKPITAASASNTLRYTWLETRLTSGCLSRILLHDKNSVLQTSKAGATRLNCFFTLDVIILLIALMLFIYR